jgi:hypothetical protein
VIKGFDSLLDPGEIQPVVILTTVNQSAVWQMATKPKTRSAMNPFGLSA